MKKAVTFWSIITAVIFLDQLTKYLITTFLDKEMIITSFFSLFLTKNTGISFGMLQGVPWLPTMIAMLVVAITPILYHKIPKHWPLQIGISLVVGGAAGNLIDRILFGAVIDFLAFSFWPAFNIADTAIVSGGIIVLIANYMDDKKRKHKKRK